MEVVHNRTQVVTEVQKEDNWLFVIISGVMVLMYCICMLMFYWKVKDNS